jgi:hypothetical protein
MASTLETDQQPVVAHAAVPSMNHDILPMLPGTILSELPSSHTPKQPHSDSPTGSSLIVMSNSDPKLAPETSPAGDAGLRAEVHIRVQESHHNSSPPPLLPSLENHGASLKPSVVSQVVDLEASPSVVAAVTAPTQKSNPILLVEANKKDLSLVDEDIVDEFLFLSASSPGILEAEERRQKAEFKRQALEKRVKQQQQQRSLVSLQKHGMQDKAAGPLTAELEAAVAAATASNGDDSEPVVIVLKEEGDNSKTISFLINQNSVVGKSNAFLFLFLFLFFFDAHLSFSHPLVFAGYDFSSWSTLSGIQAHGRNRGGHENW